eukprot:m.84690 g.84690  ORF g.84690 m.84690 type:complete len:829 (+) comp8214_c0_seq1:60-2546(+)
MATPKKFEPPLGMPTVFDPSFKGVGQKPGLDIWRVEQLKVIKKAADDKSHQGQFHEGDAYIILQTKMRENALERHIFFWLGKDSSQDEQGVAAYKTVELDMSLGGEPVQHREVQSGESDQFLALFKSGVRYLEGGVATGFKHVDRDAFTTRLLHVKGRRNIRVQQVELNPSSLNSGDVFILDAGRAIFQWNGKSASNVEKTKGLEVTKQIRDQERGGNATITIIDEGKDDDKEFWIKFGAPKPAKIKAADQGGDDEKHSREAAASVGLYQVSNASGNLQMTAVEARPLKKELLDTNDAFILDTGAQGIFVWVGKGANNEEKLHSMKLGVDFIKNKGYPNATPVTRVVEGGETPLFKQNFQNWPEKDASKGPSATVTTRKFERKSFDAKGMHAKAEREGYIMPDKGDGKLEIWRVENFELAAWPKEKYGEFYSGDSFVLLYTYLVNDKENYIIYFWQGLDSSQDEKGASAIWAKNLDDKYGGAPVQVRVVQNKEPPHFYLLFKGKMIVHGGGHASGFKNRDDKDEYYTADGTRMFQIRGTNDLNTRAIQVPPKAGSLNSGDVFVLETPKQLFLWSGKLASGDEREYAKAITKTISKKEYSLLIEGQEPAGFWEALGGKTEYMQVPEHNDPVPREPRLFQCSNNKGYFYVEEIFDYDQEDLIEDDVMLLDAGHEVFVWIGNGANTEEKKKALETAVEYIKTDASGRTVESTCFLTVKQGFEPPNFTGHFIAWNPNKWSQGKSYAELKKALAGGGELTTSLASELAKFTVSAKFTFAQLSGANLPEGVDATQKEQYLLPEEFKQKFGISREEYNALPQWKKNGLKKKAGLY